MFGKGIRLFELSGFAVEIDLSWLLIFAFITWSLAVGYFPAFFPGQTTGMYWWMGFVGGLGLFASIVLHELSHSLVARRYGLEMRGIRLFIFGGVAQMDQEPASPKAEFLMAIAGPIASVVIAAVAYGLYRLGRVGDWGTPAVALLFYFAWVNAIVAAFNTLPAFPLDGGRILRSILWRIKGDIKWATRIASHGGSAFAIFLMVLGFLNLLGGSVIGGIWWILLGLFLRAAATSSYQQLLVRDVLATEPVDHVMTTDVRTVPPDITVRELVEDHVYRWHFKMFPVTEDGRLVGCVTTRRIREIPHEEWDHRMVGEIMEPCSNENTISSRAGALEALQRMNRDGRSRLIAVEDGRLQGVISLKDLSRLISLKLELETEGELDMGAAERTSPGRSPERPMEALRP